MFVRGALISLVLLLVTPMSASAAGPGGWSNVGGGLNDTVSALNADQPGVLYVGGRFTDAGGNAAADRIAMWNGTAWGNLGPADSLPGAASSVNAIAVFGGRVYAGGTFGDGAGPKPDFLAVWDGVAWQPTCATLSAGVLSLEVVGGTLFVGGNFLDVSGDPAADQLIRCDAATGAYLGPTVDMDSDLDGGIQALAGDSAGNLYAGGTFINLDAVAQADYVAKFNGGWSALGSGSGPGLGAIDTANVDSLAADGTTVYVGTDADDIAGDPAIDYVGRWNGSSWSSLGSGFFPAPTAVNGIAVGGGEVFVTGSFQNGGGNAQADNVARFSGTGWSNVGSNGAGNGPFLGTGNAVAIFGSSLIVGGGFVDAGGDSGADRIASFPLSGSGGGGSAPPDVEIGKSPKRKIVTTKPKAKVTFTFDAAGASGFECRLDKAAFADCSSPKKYRVKPGRHTFSVQALDATGAPGAVDTSRFKVKRKR